MGDLLQSPGRAEASRLMLAYKGVEYEDCRITNEQWAALKPKTPFGSLPLLCYNGMELAQSMTIARFLARELNLAERLDVKKLAWIWLSIALLTCSQPSS